MVFILGVAILCLLAVGIYNLPPVYERLAWRVANLRAQIKYFLDPPEEAVFVPEEQVAAIVQATLFALTEAAPKTPTPTATFEPIQSGPTDTPSPTFTATQTPTALPASVYLSGVTHHYQTWNNCGPATLSMGLSYWDVFIYQGTTAAYLKPNARDKNVFPYEMSNYIADETGLVSYWRMGGEIELLKTMLANGFPVLVEKGFQGQGFDGWMGHYELLSGYDDAYGVFIAQDSYRGPDYHISYDDLLNDWRAFNYTFLMISSREREAELWELLGPWQDEDWAYRHALEIAQNERDVLSGQAQFFAWFNAGTSHVYLREYVDAAYVYDYAFGLYASLLGDERPWRTMWYQTGPYWAYYYSGRYQDVINLASTTLGAMDEPVLEESYYWRALAREAQGDISGAISDLNESVRLNPNFGPGWDQLARLNGDN
jgi:tetratricopeptide (TPR) repeat protein